jgi:hypothetical protein
MFEAEKALVYDVFRAAALRPIAEAYDEMGDEAAALDVYRRAVEEGARNPNSRPRAQDLVATTLSMAMRDVRPDEALRARMREIRDGLGDPW